jgi:Annexin
MYNSVWPYQCRNRSTKSTLCTFVNITYPFVYLRLRSRAYFFKLSPTLILRILKKTYFDMFTKDLGSELTRELGGDLEQLALNALQAMEEEYDEGKYDDDKMTSDMKALNKMGEGNWRGTDEAGMFKIMVKAPPEYLKKINMKYAEEYGNTLVKALENELNGTVQDVALYLFGSKTDPKKEAAKLIHKACAGLGTFLLFILVLE